MQQSRRSQPVVSRLCLAAGLLLLLDSNSAAARRSVAQLCDQPSQGQVQEEPPRPTPAEISINHGFDPLHKFSSHAEYRPQDEADSNDARVTSTAPPVPAAAPRKLYCRYDNLAALRPANKGRLLVSDLEPTLCTHIIYGTFGLMDGVQIYSTSPEVDYKENGGLDQLAKLAELKRNHNNNPKTILSVGDSKVDSATFSMMASNPRSRREFVQNVAEFLDRYAFDGLELSWHFPGSAHGKKEDKNNYVYLLRDLRNTLAPMNLSLSAQVGAVDTLIETGYHVAEVSKHLDSIHLMAYDYRELREPVTGHMAPLYDSMRFNMTKPEDVRSNVNWSVLKWLELGAPADKLMLGVTYYGLTFMLDRASNNGLYAPANEPATAGPLTDRVGLQGYVEFCEDLQHQPSPWTVVRDKSYLVPYAFNNRLWISYEDAESLKAKVDYVIKKSLGGLVVNSLDTDDYLGRCHSNVKYPLTKAIRNELFDKSDTDSHQKLAASSPLIEPSPHRLSELHEQQNYARKIKF